MEQFVGERVDRLSVERVRERLRALVPGMLSGIDVSGIYLEDDGTGCSVIRGTVNVWPLPPAEHVYDGLTMRQAILSCNGCGKLLRSGEFMVCSTCRDDIEREIG